MGAHSAMGSVFWGVCSAQSSVMFRGLWCSGVCAVWGLHFLGFAVLEGLCCIPQRSASLQALDFVSSPHPSLAIPAPSFLLQSPSPSPPAPPAPLSLLQTLPTIPAMSAPGGILPGTDPGPLLSLLLPDLLLPALRVLVPAAGSSTAAFPARPAASWDLSLMSPRKGTGFRPWGRGHCCLSPSEG